MFTSKCMSKAALCGLRNCIKLNRSNLTNPNCALLENYFFKKTSLLQVENFYLNGMQRVASFF